jgi:hypothetical protein
VEAVAGFRGGRSRELGCTFHAFRDEILRQHAMTDKHK